MNSKGSEALFQASLTCKLRLVRMLVEGGTSVNARNERLQTPLMLCCQAQIDMDEKGRVVSYLLSKQAKVNLQDIEGRTALIYACISNSGKEIIKALLDAKSNPWLEDESKNTVFDYVMNAEDLETTRLLINACRESMMVDARDHIQVKHIEECLANIQDIRKFSWPLMGPRIRRDHSYLYAAEKEDPPISTSNLLGAELGDNDDEKAQPERRRKRSVCHFDPLDIEEILNCSEETETGTKTTNTEDDHDDKSESDEKRKTSVRSLSEEERFSFQISDAENAPRDASSGLEKLLKLQDSFCSSFDSNDFPYSDSRRNSEDVKSRTANEHNDEINNSIQEEKSGISSGKLENGDQQILAEGNSIQERTTVNSSKEKENTIETKYINHRVSGEESRSEHSSSNSLTERSETVNSHQYEMFNEKASKTERLFMYRVSSEAVSETKSYTSASESSIQNLRHVTINSTIDKTLVQNIENRFNRIISPVSSQQSSPVISPLASPRVTRRVTHTAVTVKHSPRASPVPIAENDRREAVPIVRRYTLSAMDMGKFQNAGVKTLLALPKQSAGAETDTRRGSAVVESTTSGGPEGSFTPPGLRKSKSDLTNWTSIKAKEFIEISPKPGPNIQQLSDHGKDGSDVPEFLLPSISSTKMGRRSPQPVPVISPASNSDSRLESALTRRNNGEKQRFYLGGQEFPFDEQKRSPSPIRNHGNSLPSSPKDLAIPSPNSPCDVIAIAKTADLSPRGSDNAPGDVLPDLLFNYVTKLQHGEESSAKQGGTSVVTPQNFNNRTFKDALTPSTEERSTSSSHSQQLAASRRLRPRTLLPPLTINNRRSPTHELEDGYFSGSPSPADVESPRRKSSNEQQRYSFRPISPRSPVRSPKLFNLQSGKPPPSR